MWFRKLWHYNTKLNLSTLDMNSELTKDCTLFVHSLFHSELYFKNGVYSYDILYSRNYWWMLEHQNSFIIEVGYRARFLVVSQKFGGNRLDPFIRVCGGRKYQKLPLKWKIQDAPPFFRRPPSKWLKFLKNWYLSTCMTTYVPLFQ